MNHYINNIILCVQYYIIYIIYIIILNINSNTIHILLLYILLYVIHDSITYIIVSLYTHIYTWIHFLYYFQSVAADKTKSRWANKFAAQSSIYCYHYTDCKKCQYRTLHWFFSVFLSSRILLVYKMVPHFKCNGSTVKRYRIHPTPVHILLRSLINICLSLLLRTLTLINKIIIALFAGGWGGGGWCGLWQPLKLIIVGTRKLSTDVVPLRVLLKVLRTKKSS